MKYLLSLFLTTALMSFSFAQNALQFDGMDDHAIAPTSGPTGTMNRTVEAWVKMDALVTTQIVVVNWGDMAIGQRFTLNIIDGFPRIEIGGEGVSSTTAMSLGTWHHLAATYDQLSSTPYKLYLDGTLVASAAFGVPINTSNVNGITIGRRVDGINYFIGPLTRFVSGIMHDYRRRSQVA